MHRIGSVGGLEHTARREYQSGDTTWIANEGFYTSQRNPFVVAFSGSEIDVMSRWAAAAGSVVDAINSQDFDYELIGLFEPGQNSNSVAYSVGLLMGITPDLSQVVDGRNFENSLNAPGWERNLIQQTRDAIDAQIAALDTAADDYNDRLQGLTAAKSKLNSPHFDLDVNEVGTISFITNEGVLVTAPPDRLLEAIQSKVECFTSGTLIDMADGSQKPIEAIEAGDEVLAYHDDGEGRGALQSARVARTFVNEAPVVLNFHGLEVTPGHHMLCGDGPFEGRHRPLIDILREDGALVDAEGALIRAATNCAVGSLDDEFIDVAYVTKEDGSDRRLSRLRLGTRLVLADGSSASIHECLVAQGFRLVGDGLIASEGEDPHPLDWFGALPRPEDYVLKVSGVTLADIYSAPDLHEFAKPVPAVEREANEIARQALDQQRAKLIH
ncbi:Hint module [Rhodobiaceae bacterium]|nr:Hint module [Rhodobiaceae bacterium]